MGYPAVMAALGVRAVLMGPEGHNVRGDARDCCAELGKRLRVEPVVMGELGSGEVVGARRWRRGNVVANGEWRGRGGGSVKGGGRAAV